MKRIVVCADGTWNRPEQDLSKDFPTNVLKLARAIQPFDSQRVPQQVFYDWGIGSYYERVGGGMTGKGIVKNIMDGYRYIVQNYSPGDEIYLFGFSRGAYTVRSLCGLINNCGILRRPDAPLIEAAFKHYKKPGAKYHPDGDASKNSALNMPIAAAEFALSEPLTPWARWESQCLFLASSIERTSFTTLKSVRTWLSPGTRWPSMRCAATLSRPSGNPGPV